MNRRFMSSRCNVVDKYYQTQNIAFYNTLDIILYGRNFIDCVLLHLIRQSVKTRKQLEQVQDFKYLCSIISSGGKINAKINSRISIGSRLFHGLKTKFTSKTEISKVFKKTIFKNTFVRVLTYGAETWVLTEKHLNSLLATEMRYIRKVEGKTR